MQGVVKLRRVKKIDKDVSCLAEVAESGSGKRLLVGKMIIELGLVLVFGNC